MHALHRLRQLHLVTHQDNVTGRHAHGDQARHTHLACFIDEQVIQLLGEARVGEQPGSTGGQVDIRPPVVEKFRFVLDGADATADEFRALAFR
ncbi:hypothetical protein D3C72_2202260 [compost metagenome]